MSNTKYIQIAELIRRRISNGDYSFSTLPGAHKLAAETGVSYLTARQAVQLLINDGVLRRQSTGRLEIVAGSHGNGKRNLNVCFIRPSGEVSVWDEVLSNTAASTGSNYRTIYYSHSDDPLLFDALDGDFDLIFLHFSRTDRLFIEKLCKIKNRLVTMFHDYSHLGIRCLDGSAPESVGNLVSYLYKLGHRNFAYFNTEPQSPTIEQRLHYWQSEVERLKCTGKIYNYTVKPFSPSHYHAYLEMNNLLSGTDFNATAMFASTVNVATGIIRSCYEHKLDIPGKLSLCSFGNPDRAELTIPSLTIIERPNPTPEVEELFQNFIHPEKDNGRLIFRTGSNAIRVAESTGSAPVQSSIKRIQKDEIIKFKSIQSEVVS